MFPIFYATPQFATLEKKEFELVLGFHRRIPEIIVNHMTNCRRKQYPISETERPFAFFDGVPGK